MDKKYMTKRKPEEKWSTLRFPKEKPPKKNFQLCRMALRQICPPEVFQIGSDNLHITDKNLEMEVGSRKEALDPLQRRCYGCLLCAS